MKTLAWVFLRDGGLRPGWRLLGWLVSLVVAVTGATLGVMLVALAWSALIDAGWVRPLVDLGIPLPDELLGLVLSAPLTLAIALVAHAASTWLFGIRWDQQLGRIRLSSLRQTGLGGPVLRSGLELVGGLGVGTVALLPALGVLAIGGLHFELGALDPTVFLGFALMTAGLVCAASFEEIAFRGEGLAWLGRSLSGLVDALGRATGLALAGRLADGIGFGLPWVGHAALFGLLHAGNPSAGVLSSLNTVLAGLWLGALVLHTRSLWMAIGAHIAWNHVHGLILGLPLSGLGSETALPSLLRTTAEGPEWLSGGGYGVEGSVGATLAMLIMIPATLLLPRRPRDLAHTALTRPTARP